MYAVVEKEIFGHRSVFESQMEKDAVEWKDGLERIHGNRYKIIKK